MARRTRQQVKQLSDWDVEYRDLARRKKYETIRNTVYRIESEAMRLSRVVGFTSCDLSKLISMHVDVAKLLRNAQPLTAPWQAQAVLSDDVQLKIQKVKQALAQTTRTFQHTCLATSCDTIFPSVLTANVAYQLTRQPEARTLEQKLEAKRMADDFIGLNKRFGSKCVKRG